MKAIVRILVVFFLLVQLTTLHIDAEETPKTIVVIHAYHLGYQWTLNNNEGLRETILAKYPDANIYTEFLDWKRFPDEEILNSKYDEYAVKYGDKAIDLVLITDDMGLEFALDHREALFDNAPVAFSGIIEHTATEIIGGRQDVTGVYENMRPEGAFELMQRLQPKVTDIVFIYDRSESGVRTAEAFYGAAENLGIEDDYVFHDWQDKDFDTIKKEVSILDETTAVMLFSYSISADGIVKSTETFCEEISAVSDVPMYSNGEAMFGHGITGGTFLSGVLQGNTLGQLGIQILEGMDPESIPHVNEATVYTGVDEDQLIRYKLDIDLVGEDVRVINEHFSFIEVYRELVITTLAIIFALVIFVGILMNKQRALKKSQREVMGQKFELQALYEQLQASEEELRAQNEELAGYQEHLEYEVRHDPLTKLPNRTALDDYMKSFLVNVHSAGRKAIVVFVDLDNFKFVNNTYGHYFGDKVLQHVAKRLNTLGENIFTARIGGDEFIVTQSYDRHNEADMIDCLMRKINQVISQPMSVEDERILVKASIGYSIYPEDGNTYDQLIIEADTAMYQAKKEGKSSTRRYSKAMSNVYQNEYIMTNSLKEAYVNKEFYLVYQPIMLADGSAVTSFEALARWNSPVHGNVPPDVFIQLAETSGLIIPIGYHIIDQALNFAKRMNEQGNEAIKISINISVVQFYDEEFVNIFLLKIKNAGLEASTIQIEITESVMIETYKMLTDKLAYLREQGITVALDDFGTGYSSLAYLHELPIDVLKVDKVFVDDIIDEHTKSPLVDATVTLAENFGLTLVAEGVEKLAQLNYLRRMGCRFIQGYYFSKPLPDAEALAFCKEH